MTFPVTRSSGGGDLVPSARTFESGDYPVKTYKAQNGAEHRILYGNKRTNMKLSLTYANILDADAELFLDHYDTVQGTFQTFSLGSVGADRRNPTRGGWEGNKDVLGAETHGNNYRYEGPPQVQQVALGRSTVTVNLIGVL
ncbi:MAG TPA: hypothetical protein DCX94_15305 [Alteromonas macleodii]|jgi:hypothetical protein|nr:hypothetical protein [Alteromonas macleodii]|tara:strand:+ start:250 stop:672 length:423 start_codon:yes stop_codon:yes gene_type:complete